MENNKIIIKINLFKGLLKNLKNMGGEIEILPYGDNYAKVIINNITLSTKVILIKNDSLKSVNAAYRSLARYWINAVDAKNNKQFIEELKNL